ncbi:MAG: GMC oxidoreductase [Thermoleophilaceae bacterium]
MPRPFDHDWIVIGSGFGGSVSALRLAQKGHRVKVLEAGSRYDDEDFAKTTWNVRRYFFAPKLGLRGIFKMSLFKHLFVVSGAGVGGGSLGYANTLYRPREGSAFYRDSQWAGLADWHEELERHYDTAEHMLGVTDFDGEGPADRLLKELGEELGVRDTYRTTRVGVFFGEAGQTVSDPYFGGEGPERAGCVRCGACMVGCRYNAKNTLPKNYLYFAERMGVEVEADRTVVDVRPLGAPDGSEGYEVVSERSDAWFRRDSRTETARGVVMAGGPLGTNKLLQRCKRSGSLPRVSDRLGDVVRTNSEAVGAVTTKDDRHDFTKSIAITSSIYPDESTHIENVTYGRGADSMSFLFWVITGPGGNVTRPIKALANAVRHPAHLLRSTWPLRWSRRTVILLTMQTLDNVIRLEPRRALLGRGVRLQTREDPERPNPRFIPVHNWALERAGEKLDAVPQSGTTEALMNVPLTAHILGGAVIGEDASKGVIDSRHRVFGYEGLLVCDGSAVPANVGVNPSLTITAMTERAMSLVDSDEDLGSEASERSSVPASRAEPAPSPSG